MVMADASPVRQPAASSPAASTEKSLIASLTPPPAVQPAVLTEDEAAFFTALGRRVTDAATAYDGYVRHAAAIDPGFSDPAAVQRAVKAGSDYQPEQLQQGIVAYAAMIALRSPAFVEGVRVQAQADPGFADRVSAQPAAVLQVPGAAQAAADVAGVLRAHGFALQTTGRAIGKAAYDIQAQPWSKQPVANPVEVLAAVKASAAQARAADAPSEKMLLQSLVAAPRSDGSGPPSATPAVVRGMAVAALAVMGRAGDKEDLRIATLLQEGLSAECLKMATLNMNQCLAAAGPHYDDVFCVGEHSVGETARCVSTAADGGGQSAPADPGLRIAAAQTSAQGGGNQAAGGQGYGPEEAAAYGYAPRPAAAADDEAATPAAPPAPQQVADAAPYPPGDGTFNGQIYARRAQQQPQYQQQAQDQQRPYPPQYQQSQYQQAQYQQPQYQQPYRRQPAAYAYQDAPPPPRPAPQSPYGYGPYGGGYAPYGGGYYAQPQGPAPAYEDQGYAPR